MHRPLIVALGTVGAFFIVFLATSFLVPERSDWENPPERFGTRDFIAFWSGTHLFLNGRDPYQSANMLEVEQTLMPHMKEAQVFLNPPWSLPIYTVLFWPPYSSARVLWIILNFVFLYGIIHFAIRLHIADSHPYTVVTGMAFLPALMTIWMGQATLLVLFFALFSFYLYQQKKIALSACAALPVICKPHLVFLFFAWWGLLLLQRKQFLWPILFVLGVLILSGLALLQLPDAFTLWQQADFSPLVFKTSTIATRIRNLILDTTGDVVVWPVMAVPLCSLFALCVWYFASTSSKTNEEEKLPLLFALSIACAPYAWFYDYATLLPLHLYVLSIIRKGASGKHRRRWLVYGLSPQLLVLFAAEFTSDLGGYYWFPWIFLALLAVTTRRFKEPCEDREVQDDSSASPLRG